MGLLEKLKRRKLLLSFEIALGGETELGVRTVPAQLEGDSFEWVRFWAFATARILYDIWFANTPQAFLALHRVSLVFERDLDPGTDCLRRAELYQFHYVDEVSSAAERIAGEYLGRDHRERTIRFLAELPFEGNTPRPLLMVSSVALLQHVLDWVKPQPRGLAVLSATGRMLVTQFATEEWAGAASMEKLPQAAFTQAVSPFATRRSVPHV